MASRYNLVIIFVHFSYKNSPQVILVGPRSREVNTGKDQYI